MHIAELVQDEQFRVKKCVYVCVYIYIYIYIYSYIHILDSDQSFLYIRPLFLSWDRVEPFEAALKLQF